MTRTVGAPSGRGAIRRQPAGPASGRWLAGHVDECGGRRLGGRGGAGRWRVAGAVLPLLLLLAGCTATDPPEASASPPPFADCAALTTAPAGVEPIRTEISGFLPSGGSPELAPGATGPTVAVPPARDTPAAEPPHKGQTGGGDNLPDLSLPCFSGGEEIRLAEIHGPAVINLWASWCPPCRKELPAFQRLAHATAGTLHVVGVVTKDDRDSAAAFGAYLGLTFPNLDDREERLRIQIAAAGLPVTVFVDEQGRIRHVESSGAVTDLSLKDLVERHLGVPMPS